MGARGNSGVILSQIVRGAADVLGETTNGIDAALDGPRAARRDRRGLPRRAPPGRGDDALGHPRARRGGGGAAPAIRSRSASCSSSSCGAGRRRSRARPTSCRSCATRASSTRAARGCRAPARRRRRRHRRADAGGAAVEEPTGIEAIHQELSRYRYCTVFLIEGEELDREALEAQLEQLGDSLLVVGDENAIKVHVHTDDPGAALSIGTRRRHDRPDRDREHARADAAARGAAARVVPDRAAREDRHRRGRRGRRQPASLREPRRAGRPDRDRRGRPDDEPVDRRARSRAVQSTRRGRGDHPPEQLEHRLAAEHAAAHADRTSRSCRPTRSRPGSRRWSPSTARAPPPRTRRRCAQPLAAVATGEVTIASRDVEINGIAIRKGDWLGLADGEPVAGGDDFDDVALAVVEQLLARAARAADAPDRRRAAAARRRSSSGSPRRIPRSRSTSRRAGSRTTRFCSARNRVRAPCGRSGSSSSRTTRSSARRSSSCSACARTSRSSPRSATAAPRSRRRASTGRTSC